LETLSENYALDTKYIQSDLGRYPKRDLLKLCGQLANLIQCKSDADFQKDQALILRSLKENRWIDEQSFQKLGKRMSSTYNRGVQSALTHRPGLLEFLKWVCWSASEKESARLPAPSVHLIRAFLSCTELYGKREIAPTLAPSDSSAPKYLQFIHRASQLGGQHVDEAFELGRTSLLLVDEFFCKHPEYQEQFTQAFGITIHDWLTCHCVPILTHQQMKGQFDADLVLGDRFVINAERVMSHAPHMTTIFNTFLKLISMNVEELVASFGENSMDSRRVSQRPIRTRPLLALDESNYIALDRRFLIENLAVGPIFMLNNKLGSYKPMQDFGAAFQRFAYSMFERPYKAACQGAAQFLVDEPPGSTQPLEDIIFGSDKTLAIVEVKGVFLHEDVPFVSDPADHLKEILKKYGQAKGGPKEKPKGVAQICAAIKGLEDGSNLGQGLGAAANCASEIIPVLVVFDQLLADSFFCRALGDCLVDMLSLPRPDEGAHSFTYKRFEIHKLVVISVRDAEVLANLVPQTTLVDVIKEYSIAVPLRNNTLSQYLKHPSTKTRWQAKDDLIVTKRAIETIDQTRQVCFGDKSLT